MFLDTARFLEWTKYMHVAIESMELRHDCNFCLHLCLNSLQEKKIIVLAGVRLLRVSGSENIRSAH